jgi:hypothetical protein
MQVDSHRLFRRIWLTNGILLLLLMLGALGLAGYALLNELWGTDDDGVRPTANGAQPSAELRPRAIRYDDPELVLNSRWMLVQVRYGTDYSEPTGSSLGLTSAAYDRGYDAGGPLVNVLFLPEDGGPGRLLLNRPAYIRALKFPRERRGYPAEHIDSVPWITYDIALEDTDRSGRLDHEDAAELYISDLGGENFRRVLPAGFRVRSTQVLPNLQLLVTALDARESERAPEDQLPQRAFRFNPRTGRLTPDAVLDSLASSAGRILGRP